MKQERIEELLLGTKYEGHKCIGIIHNNNGPDGYVYNDAGEELKDDAALNAARVQLLAKALQSLIDVTASSMCQDDDLIRQSIEAAKNALREAGLDKYL